MRTFSHADSRIYEGIDRDYPLSIAIELVGGYYECDLTMDTHTWRMSFMQLRVGYHSIVPGVIVARNDDLAIDLAWLYCEGYIRDIERRDAQAKYRFWKQGAQGILDTLATADRPLIPEYAEAETYARKAIRALNPDFILSSLQAATNSLQAGNAVMEQVPVVAPKQKYILADFYTRWIEEKAA